MPVLLLLLLCAAPRGALADRVSWFLPGYAPAEPFLHVLRFIHADAYEEMSFEEYLEANR